MVGTRTLKVLKMKSIFGIKVRANKFIRKFLQKLGQNILNFYSKVRANEFIKKLGQNYSKINKKSKMG